MTTCTDDHKTKPDCFQLELRLLANRLTELGISGPDTLVLYNSRPVDLRSLLSDGAAISYWHGQAMSVLTKSIRQRLVAKDIVLSEQDIYNHLNYLSGCDEVDLVRWAEHYIEHRYRD
jgi:hypothetical protein